MLENVKSPEGCEYLGDIVGESNSLNVVVAVIVIPLSAADYESI
jgi:hypothetical protein